MAGQSKAVRIGIITAAVIGAVAIPATAFAANSGSMGTHSMADAVTAVHAQMTGGEDFAAPADRRGGEGGPQAEAHLAKLAASLNVSVETLKAAMDATRAELKDQKPATPADRRAFAEKHLTTLAGKLNISVDALKKAIEANRPQRPEGKGPDGKRPGGGHAQHAQALATALGVTPEALKTATEQARKDTKPATRPADDAARQAQEQAFITSLAANLNLSVDKVKAAIEQTKLAKPTVAEQKAMLQPRLAEMVTSGKLTQAQADKILADVDAGKPVFEVLKQFMPQLGGGDHGPRGQQGEHGPRGSQGQQGQQRQSQGQRPGQQGQGA